MPMCLLLHFCSVVFSVICFAVLCCVELCCDVLLFCFVLFCLSISLLWFVALCSVMLFLVIVNHFSSPPHLPLSSFFFLYLFLRFALLPFTIQLGVFREILHKDETTLHCLSSAVFQWKWRRKTTDARKWLIACTLLAFLKLLLLLLQPKNWWLVCFEYGCNYKKIGASNCVAFFCEVQTIINYSVGNTWPFLYRRCVAGAGADAYLSSVCCLAAWTELTCCWAGWFTALGIGQKPRGGGG